MSAQLETVLALIQQQQALIQQQQATLQNIQEDTRETRAMVRDQNHKVAKQGEKIATLETESRQFKQFMDETRKEQRDDAKSQRIVAASVSTAVSIITMVLAWLASYLGLTPPTK